MWTDQLKEIYREGAETLVDNSSLSVKKANVEIYKDASTSYEEHTHETHIEVIRRLRVEGATRSATGGKVGTVVDVGCAVGIGLDEGTSEFENVVGVDISIENLKEVSRKGFIAVLADAEKLPFRCSSIDLVTCFAALHHLPAYELFLGEAFRCITADGVLVTGGDPSQAGSKKSLLAELVWDARKPIYRFLSLFSARFYMHKDKEMQEINDIAEVQRTSGGFDPVTLDVLLHESGFGEVNVFHGVKELDGEKYQLPEWKTGLLKVLSLQNPFLIRNTAELCSISKKTNVVSKSI